METAKSSNSDTLLQGLMGRFCGYESEFTFLNTETTFYIHTNNIDGPTEYVNYFKTLGSKSPSSGMNLIRTRSKLTYAPLLKIPLIDRSKAKITIDSLNIDVLSKIPLVGYRYRTKGRMELEEGVVPAIQPGHGALFEKEVNIYDEGEWSYLLYAISERPDVSITTTKKEIFSTQLKTLYQNGYVIGGPRPESFSNVSEMLTDIHKLILATKISDGQIPGKMQNAGRVQLSVKVFESFQPTGIIYKQMLEDEGVRIKTGRIISQDESYVIVQDVTW